MNFESYLYLCKSCGYGFLNPSPDKKSYKIINNIWYKKKFSLSIKKNEKKLKIRHKKTISRLNTIDFFSKSNLNVLDIGSGYGELLDELKKEKKKINYYGLEQYNDAQKAIILKGGKIINSDINDNWSEEFNSIFDLIVFRHTLEHLDDINLAIKQISISLNNLGVAYIVVPNSLDKDIKNIRTDYCRPVHLSYFNFFSLAKVIKQNNLNIISYDEGNKEIWILCSLNNEKKDNNGKENNGEKNFNLQKKMYIKKIKQYFYSETWKIIKIHIKRILLKIKIINY